MLLLLLQVHKGFLTSFNDLMTGGDTQQMTMKHVADELMGGKEPTRCVDSAEGENVAQSAMRVEMLNK
jgi:hypothetical protein